MGKKRIVVIGGGAAGFFASIAAAERDRSLEVMILEHGRQPLAKVLASGGGRCNVTHACFDPKLLAGYYPRGGKELIGPFHRWQPRDTIEWFESRGVPLKAEPDGRVFPVTDQSGSIADCLLKAARDLRVQVRLQDPAIAAERTADGTAWRVFPSSGEPLVCDRVLLAPGGNPSGKAYAIAEKLGHTIEPLVPSLFTFKVPDRALGALAGISLPKALLTVDGTRLRSEGPLLITHWGFSGPAVLALSAWGARELHARDYRFSMRVNWLGGITRERLLPRLQDLRTTAARKTVLNAHPDELPKRLWEYLLQRCAIDTATQWGRLSNRTLETLCSGMTGMEFEVRGKSPFKEEFVTCGGVRLSEVDFRTMESKLHPGLLFAGEFLDIDGITGGFNFQAAWTTGWIASGQGR